ncbi:MAG TPA: hypothetical protein VGC66_02845 [Pyrinomonadaceae bacterium]
MFKQTRQRVCVSRRHNKAPDERRKAESGVSSRKTSKSALVDGRGSGTGGTPVVC